MSQQSSLTDSETGHRMVDRTAAVVIVDKVKAANIPVAFFNRELVEEDLRMWNRAYNEKEF